MSESIFERSNVKLIDILSFPNPVVEDPTDQETEDEGAEVKANRGATYKDIPVSN